MATPIPRDDRSKASRFGLHPPRLTLLSKTYTTSWDITAGWSRPMAKVHNDMAFLDFGKCSL
ncbi:hypothetical protein GALL_377200 [mine drainage metagenome]|uniref:Uncharacterized protein n=1 Tax=mine drainage metagenome TaxID=410659 RepID=A0A1J5QKN8_9ZZZZ